jgi:ABC-2 type transport system permease protein
MVLIDQSTYSVLGYLIFPNWNAGLILLVLAPLGSVSAVELNVILSARMNDPRAVQQLGAILVLPFLGIFVAALDGYISVDTSSLLVICAIVFAAAVALFYLSKAAFRREEILTRWK